MAQGHHLLEVWASRNLGWNLGRSGPLRLDAKEQAAGGGDEGNRVNGGLLGRKGYSKADSKRSTTKVVWSWSSGPEVANQETR